MSTLTLEQIRAKEGDRVVFPTKAGSTLTGIVIDASDRSLLRVQLANGNELRVGRATVSVAARKAARVAA